MIEVYKIISELKAWDENPTVFQLLDEFKGPDFLKLITRLSRKIINKSKEFTNNALYIESFYVHIKEDEEPSVLAIEIVNFLANVLLMPITNEQADALTTNFSSTTDKDSLIACLKYILFEKTNAHTKNAYLGAYLVPLNIPPEYQSLASIQQLKTQSYEKRDEFIAVHKRVSAVQSDFDALNSKEQMAIKKEEEKRILQQQIKSLDAKIKKSPQTDQWLSVCKNYYAEQCLMNEYRTKLQDLNKLMLDLEEQEAHSEYQKSALEEKLQESAESILQRLNEDFRKSSYIYQSQKEDVENQSKILAALQQTLTKTITRVDNVNIENSIAKINADLNIATQNLISKESSGLSLLEQQLNLLTNKKTQLQEKLFDLNGSFPQLDQNNPSNHLKSLKQEYIIKKGELNELTNQKTQLITQLQLAQNKYDLRIKEMEQLEAQANVQGFTKMRDEIAKLSNKKSKLDHSKLTTLEEVSKLVIEINGKIADKKALIAPKSSQLKKLRTKISKQEEIINEKQFAYDAKILNVKKEVADLSILTTTQSDTLVQLQGRKDELEDLLEVAQEHQGLLKEEKKKNSNKSEESMNSIREMLKRKQFELEIKLKDASEMEKEIREVMEPNKNQVAAYKLLSQLLELRQTENEQLLSKSNDAQGTENRMVI